MWIGATFYDGKLPYANTTQTWSEFGHHLVHLVYEGAYPTAKAWAIYWTFFVAEAIMYVAHSDSCSPGTTLTLMMKVLLHAWCSHSRSTAAP